MRYDEDERVASCQREIQRLRSVVWEMEEEYKFINLIARRAIKEIESENQISHEELLTRLNITKEEYKKFMEE